MTADVIQDRRVTVPTLGSTHPVFVEGSRQLWALPSPMHEGLGIRAIEPDRIQGDADFPHAFIMARSRITSRRSCRARSARPFKFRTVLTPVKAWPGNGRVCRSHDATASLDWDCARRTQRTAVGTKKRLGQTKKRCCARAWWARRVTILPTRIERGRALAHPTTSESGH